MEDILIRILNAIARFEYLIAKREYGNLLDLIKTDKVAGDRFLQNHMKPHQKTIKNMLHKCDEINLAFEGH